MSGKAFWVWRYELRSSARLNSISERRTFPGALVRSGSGFACVHPWPELGDPSLEDALQNLSPRALFCLELDGKAREAGRSLFCDLKIPPSHATLPEVTRFTLKEARERGFTHVKAKTGKDLASLRALISENADLIWRLDFNGQGTAEMFSGWSQAELAPIDFVEDPFPPGDWKILPVTTANDRYQGGGEVDVLKPAVDEVHPSPRRTIVTSYMDHPVGQAFAAYEARMFPDEIHGLQTHGFFEADSFTETLGPVAPSFTSPNGTGLGFDDLLEKLPWKKLT